MLRVLLTLWLLFAALPVCAASARTRNFLVTAPTEQLAIEVADASEAWRKRLFFIWTGNSEPADWPQPAQVRVELMAERFSGGGSTSFAFNAGRVIGPFEGHWYGPREKLLADVVPHEVLHTVLATHFGRPLPRAIDEGAACCSESRESQLHQYEQLFKALQTGRGIGLSQLLAIRDYPRSTAGVVSLYAHGWSLVRFLIDRKAEGGERVLVAATADAFRHGWPAAIRTHYGYDSLPELQAAWLDWIRAGVPGNSRWQEVAYETRRCENGRCVPGWFRQIVPAAVQPRAQTVVNPPPVTGPVINLVEPVPIASDAGDNQSLRDKLALMEAKLAEDRERIRELVEHAKQAKAVLTDPETDKAEKAAAIAGWAAPWLLGLLGISVPTSLAGAYQVARWGYRKWKGRSGGQPAPATIDQSSLQADVERYMTAFRQQQEAKQSASPAAPADTFRTQANRDATAAHQLLELLEVEGHNPIFYAYTGLAALDELNQAIQRQPEQAAVLNELRSRIDRRVNQFIPVTETIVTNAAEE